MHGTQLVTPVPLRDALLIVATDIDALVTIRSQPFLINRTYLKHERKTAIDDGSEMN